LERKVLAIKIIRASNFKGFADVDMHFGPFNVLIGANASGKTGVVQIFRFLRDVAAFELENAISLQGGPKYLRNMAMSNADVFRVEAVTDRRITFRLRTREDRTVSLRAESQEVTHILALGFKKRGQGYEIIEDRLIFKVNFSLISSLRQRGIELGTGEIKVERVKGRPSIAIKLPPNEHLKEEDVTFPYWYEELRSSPHRTVSFNLPLYYLSAISESYSGDSFGEIGIYDFDPKLPKKAVQITGKAELNEDGSNFALILKSVIADKSSKRKLSNLVRDLLPFIEDVTVENFSDKSLLFKMRESHLKKEYLPASLVSDGTISIALLIVALYFERKAIVVLEEPEKNIHPYLMSKLVAMMRDASERKQIIITTHNPEIVKFAGLENLILLSKTSTGSSTVHRPLDKEEVRVFLENEIGVEQLYIQNLL
jgi:predicted ATPase